MARRKKEEIDDTPSLFDAEEDLMTIKPQVSVRNKRKLAKLVEVEETAMCRRAYGVTELLKLMRLLKPEKGKSYHILTGGNIDLLSHVWWLFYHYAGMKSIFMSCWSINLNDIMMVERMIREGKLGKFEMILGESFRKMFKVESKKIEELQAEGIFGNVYMSSIHSKFCAIETVEGEKIVIESSANCNANRRVEQSIITVSEELHDFYIEYFKELFEIEMCRRTNNEIENAVIIDDIEDDEIPETEEETMPKSW